MRTREVAMGWVRPWRASSARCHISFTGLPMAWETSAASSAASKKSFRPNEPPPSTTWTVTASIGRPSRAAIAPFATIGAFRLDQISARPGRTSAIAQFGSSALLPRKWNVNAASTLGVNGGGPSGISAARNSLSTDSSDAPATLPGFHDTRRARTASMHWPKVAARTATPVEITATSVTPGMARISPRLATEPTLPLIVGGRHTMVGMASGTFRSSVNRLRPVTAARASIRP